MGFNGKAWDSRQQQQQQQEKKSKRTNEMPATVMEKRKDDVVWSDLVGVEWVKSNSIVLKDLNMAMSAFIMISGCWRFYSIYISCYTVPSWNELSIWSRIIFIDLCEWTWCFICGVVSIAFYFVYRLQLAMFKLFVIYTLRNFINYLFIC